MSTIQPFWLVDVCFFQISCCYYKQRKLNKTGGKKGTSMGHTRSRHKTSTSDQSEPYIASGNNSSTNLIGTEPCNGPCVGTLANRQHSSPAYARRSINANSMHPPTPDTSLLVLLLIHLRNNNRRNDNHPTEKGQVDFRRGNWAERTDGRSGNDFSRRSDYNDQYQRSNR